MIPQVQKDDAKACEDRIKDLTKTSSRIALLWLAALILVWSTKIEPSYGPVIRYRHAANTKKDAEKNYRQVYRELRLKIRPEEKSFSKSGEPNIRWRFASSEELKSALARNPGPRRESLERWKPSSADHDSLRRLNEALRTLAKISIDAEQRKASATLVEFQILDYKFTSSVLHAPIVWNLLFLGLLFYVFLVRQALTSLLLRYATLTTEPRLYGMAWWIAPLPRLRVQKRAPAILLRILNRPQGSLYSTIGLIVALLTGVFLQARIAKMGLVVTELLGSGYQMKVLVSGYYGALFLFVVLVTFWVLPARYDLERREEI